MYEREIHVHDTTVCPLCKDTILPAAHTATACPLVTELNTKKLGSSPTVVHSLTHELAMQFTRPDPRHTIVGLACAPVHGLSINFNDAMYIQSNAVVKAAVYGYCSFTSLHRFLPFSLNKTHNINCTPAPGTHRVRCNRNLATSFYLPPKTASGKRPANDRGRGRGSAKR
jgi:hypothetical protein